MSSFLHRVRRARDHRWAPGRMSDYVDGELAVSQRARMEHHLAECEQCRRVLAGLRRMLEALALLPPPPEADAVQIAAAVTPQLPPRP